MTDAYSTINFALFLFGIGIITGHSAQNTKALKTWTLSILSIELWLVIEMLLTYDPHVGGIQFVSDMSWIHSKYWVGFDGLSLLFLLITYLLLMGCLLFSWQKTENIKSYTLTLLLIACLTTLLVGSHHLILQVVFLGLLLTSVYFHLLTQGNQRQNLIQTFGKVALIGYFWIVIGVIIIFYHGAVMTYDLTGLKQEITLPFATQLIVGFLLLIGGSYFIPLFPFHNWLFSRFTETSLSEKVILLGLLGKVIFLMLIRIIVVFLPAAATVLIPLLVVWGLIDLIYAVLVTNIQTEPNNCTGYWALSQSGLLLIILAILLSKNYYPSISPTCGSGALFLFLTLTFSAPILFFVWAFEPLAPREQESASGVKKSLTILATILFFISLGLPISPLFTALVLFFIDLTVLPAWQIITVLAITGILIGVIALGKHWLRLLSAPKVTGAIHYAYRTALIIIISGLLIGAVCPSISFKIIEYSVPIQLQSNHQLQRLK